MHPMVKPALRRAWRERQTVQFGVAPAHAVSLGPVDTATGSFLQLLDGTRGMPLLRAEARSMGLTEDRVDALVDRLAKAGLLDDPTAGCQPVKALTRRPGAVDRLRADAASLSLVHPEPGDGLRRLAARRAMHVQVRGAGRVGATVAALLSGAGVGSVEVVDGGSVAPWDVTPGGLPKESVGERRDVAARGLVRRSAPLRPPRSTARGGPGVPAGGEPAGSLVLVCPRDGLAAYAPDPATAVDWISAEIPHLYAGVIETTGVVGPLVLPGRSACAGCLQWERTERDPGWPRLLAQWRSGGRRAPVPACDLALGTAVAGLAAAHALAYLDDQSPLHANARWETSLPLLDWRRQQFVPHVDCACGAWGKSGGRDASGFAPAHETMAG
ncbi:ThiF family adenylyltransferase [Streptomyces sp. NPDC020412]|uniref:ThiF family adenylyltransferase n=1 Tax=Streptomyces sp. NPDC020412 TaxID=3365073 RepID=UPI0037B60E80